LIKENITIESSTKEFKEMVQKMINLKDKIEKEITKIDIYIIYDTIYN
jgi:hypothetical protein